MKWTPVLLGMLDSPFTSHTWIFIPLGIVGFLICYFKYKLAWAILPIIALICAMFLIYFYQDYRHITGLAPRLIPTAILMMIFSIVFPLIGTFLSWQKSKTKKTKLP